MLEVYRPELFGVVNELAKAMASEGSFKDSSWNAAKLEALLSSPDAYCALVKSEEGYYGGIIGIVTQQFFGDDLIACDLGLFILPHKRGGTAAPRLIQEFERWAKAKGAKEVHMSQSTGVEVDRTRRLYESMGYTVVGFCSKKEIRNV